MFEKPEWYQVEFSLVLKKAYQSLYGLFPQVNSELEIVPRMGRKALYALVQIIRDPSGSRNSVSGGFDPFVCGSIMQEWPQKCRKALELIPSLQNNYGGDY